MLPAATLDAATGFANREEHCIMFEVCYGFLLARRALVLAGALMASCCALWAQSDAQTGPAANGPAAGEMHRRGPERELKELTRVLSLTPDQRAQVKTLLEARRQQIEQMRNSPAPAASAGESSPQSNREQFHTIWQDTNTKIEALLTDDQKTKFTAWQQQRRQRMRRHGPDGPDAAPAPPSA